MNYKFQIVVLIEGQPASKFVFVSQFWASKTYLNLAAMFGDENLVFQYFNPDDGLLDNIYLNHPIEHEENKYEQ